MFDDTLGLLKKDTAIEMDEIKAEFYVSRGYAKVCETKAVHEVIETEVQPEKKTPKKTKVVED